MSVLTFDKKELGNLEYSLQREMLATDRRGGYMSTTIVCCNTRKYHGLMVAPIDDSDRAYVLLSSVDETVVHDGNPSTWRCTVSREPMNLGGISTSPISNIRRHRRSPTAWEASCCGKSCSGYTTARS